MTIEEKKEHVIRCIKLGMELYKAYLIAECTPDEIEILDTDKDLQRKIEITYAIAERDLLEKHNVALEISQLKGNTNPIQWKLARLNPNRWDSREKDLNVKLPEPVQVNLIGKDCATG